MPALHKFLKRADDQSAFILVEEGELQEDGTKADNNLITDLNCILSKQTDLWVPEWLTGL